MDSRISAKIITDELWNLVEIMKNPPAQEKTQTMDSPNMDLIVLKKVCKELEKVMAHTSSMDLDAVARLADEARYLADCIGTWARAK